MPLSCTVAHKTHRMRRALDLKRPDRLPLAGDWRNCEYRPDVYHLGEPESVEDGEVRYSNDGKRAFTRDGGVWAVGDRELYRTPEDVLGVDLSRFEVEEVGPAMLDEMARLRDAAAASAYPCAWHYGTLVTRATLEFGWEPFLQAAALEPEAFGRICDRFAAASLAVAEGWCRTPGIDLVFIHDDLAATRGPILSPNWYRRYVFPWHGRIYRRIHEYGRQAVFVCDGNYLPLLDDVLALEPDGLYIESTSMDPAEFMSRAGPDKIYLLKSDTRNIDHGTPEDVWAEVRRIRDLHEQYPGIIMYRGGNRQPECVRAFDEACRELLVYA